MAVPKKRRSKSKGKIKLAIWKGKGRKMANRALSLAKSILNEESKFIFNKKEVEKKIKNKETTLDIKEVDNLE